MKNDNSLDLFNKGDYQPINKNFMAEGYEVLKEVQVVQERYNKTDTDTFINELRDSMVGYYLGFDLINIKKHGFDCKQSRKNYFLEVKECSFDAKSWNAVFNDTNLDKAEAFKDEKLFLALAVWKGASDLLFIVYGQNEKLGKYLEDRINYQKKMRMRRTQSISFSTLINEYGFKVLTSKPKDEIKNLLGLKNSSLLQLSDDKILTLKEFKGINR